MAFFNERGRIRKVWNSFRQTFRTVNPNSTQGNTKHRLLSKKPLFLAVGAVALLTIAGFSGSHYVQAHTVDYVEVYHNGKLIGEVGSETQVKELISSKEKQMQEKNAGIHMVLDAGTITYSDKSAYNAKPDSAATLQKLEGLLASHATGVELIVDGKRVGVVKDKATATALLKRVEGKYSPKVKAGKAEVTALSYSADGSLKSKSALKSVKFVEKVATKEAEVQPTDIADPEQLYLQLIKGTVKPTSYTVQEGDCVGCIAHKFDISPQVIYERNKWIKEDMIKVGDVLDLTVLQPQVTVETVENVTETESIEPATVVQKNSNMKAGQSKVIRQGQSGKKQLVYRLVKQNGYLMSEELISEVVLKPSVPAIVMKGTKVTLSEGSGRFSWPVTGARLTSSFGQRWGTLHRGVDMVGNKNIMAADNGTVSFTGQRPGLGNCIIINHHNGYETVYGHLSKISVKRGQTVEKGQRIGIMGNTGHSFGTHLHFEVHKNGALQNPLKYL
ncbi:M23 family metallopeptidase [Paenibacillus sp. BC26]|uniref:M23 family metallopeptidase n=1 Tax=Paenibacillus sp. BC26 TaxID=1881032 RepID=UPI0008F0C378|nr:M23 family metallopeptidase [Paenibacillus sp. BC26]SFT23550.1 Murein DD-endopeptidase MepM and murein hydrolase activator NlpD, contain LysM domain [Paenibacillus sp. BC26]